jgi:hypothetical protein
MKRFFVTVTGHDEAPIGFSSMMMDGESMAEVKRVAVETVSEQMGFPVDAFKVTAQEKV